MATALTARIQEGHRGLAGRKDLRLVARSTKEAVFEVGSGSYHFFLNRPPRDHWTHAYYAPRGNPRS